jgi:cytochrome c oxidase subunit 2
LFPVQASSFAKEWDDLFWFETAIITAGGALVYAMLTYFCFAFAKKPGVRTPRILGSMKLEFTWTVIPLILFLVMFVWGVKLFNQATDIPPGAMEVFVVGKQWMWKMQHPDGQREINELHIPVDTDIKITVISEDVIHDFGLPAFRQKIDAVPGRYVSTWFRPTREGEYHIFCDQYCGQGHSQMVGKIYVLSKADYESWKEGTYKSKHKQNPVDGSAAWEGEKLFKKLQCITCHNGEGGQRAPNLFGIYGQKIPLADGKVATADETYLRESIRNPLAKVHEGWRPIMPAYPPSQLSESELLAVVAYIKSKKVGDKYPVRVDDSPNQTGAPVNETPKPPPATK